MNEATSRSNDVTSNHNVRERMQEIARAEIQRQRRKMGSFTPEQVSAVEALLLATANEISERITERIQKYPEQIRSKYLDVWTNVQAA
jgi:hypothetical protein